LPDSPRLSGPVFRRSVEKLTPGPVGLRTRFSGHYARAGRIALEMVAYPPSSVTFSGEARLVSFTDAGADDLERSVFVVFHRYELPGDGQGGFTPMRAIVKGDTKLAVHLLDSDELYDRSTDPHELHNRIDDPAHAAIRDALHDEPIDWMHGVRDPFRSPAWERRPWREPTTRRLSWQGGYSGSRQGWDDAYAPSRLNYGTGRLLE
jgi:hypothetical protein